MPIFDVPIGGLELQLVFRYLYQIYPADFKNKCGIIKKITYFRFTRKSVLNDFWLSEADKLKRNPYY